MRLHLIVLAILCAPSVGGAIEVIKTDETFIQTGAVSIITTPSAIYTLTEVPTTASQFGATDARSSIEDFPTNLSLGEPLDQAEALMAVDLYYKNVAFNYASIQLRDIGFHGARFVTWCSNPWLFGCLNKEFRAGHWFEARINGANRTGGMTGFTRTIFLVRKTLRL